MDGAAPIERVRRARRVCPFACLLAACLSCAGESSADPPPLPGFEGMRLRPVTVSASCEAPDRWQLAPELARTLEHEVDYIADYDDAGDLVSEAGTACADAPQSGSCGPALQAAIAALPGLPGSRLLLTLEGDQVRLWTVFGSLRLFDEIDTIEKAIWTALGHGYAVRCDARLSRRGEAFELAHLAWSSGASCMPGGSEGLRIVITADGELFTDPQDDDCALPMP